MGNGDEQISHNPRWDDFYIRIPFVLLNFSKYGEVARIQVARRVRIRIDVDSVVHLLSVIIYERRLHPASRFTRNATELT